MNVPATPDLALAEDLWDYLRLGQEVRTAQCVLVFGGHDLGVAHRAVELYRAGGAPLILVSGGATKVARESGFDAEADAIVDILRACDVPQDNILTERLATNTSENFWFSAEVLRDQKLDFDRFLIVQKPYCERRTMATARRRWPEREVRITSQVVTFEAYCAGDIHVSRILSMLVGEILRLQRYADCGLIEIDEPVPGELLAAARRLHESGFDKRSMGARHVGAHVG
jgi:hypothetical protein